MTYITFSIKSFDISSTKFGFYLVYTDIIVILTILYGVVKKFVTLFYEQRRGVSGSKFHIRLVSIFSLLTIIPSIIMSTFAIIFFHGGMESWFTEKNKIVLTESLLVAKSYLEEHKKLIKDDAIAVAKMLETKLAIIPNDITLKSKFLKTMLTLRGLADGILLDKDLNTIAQTDFAFSLEFQKLTPQLLEEALNQDVVLLNTDDKKYISAITVLDSQEQMFLIVKKPIDAEVIAHFENTKQAVEDYFNVQKDRKTLELSFAVLFLLTAVLLVISAIGIAINVASRIIEPISKLIDAAQRIRDGNLSARVNLTAKYDEIDILNKTFNQMGEKLQNQHHYLIKINHDLDHRIQFIENVLYSISSGVIGLDNKQNVYIANESVKNILKLKRINDVTKIFPQINTLFEKAKLNINKVIEETLPIKINTYELLILVRVIYDPKKLNGFVITMDDLTEISLAQRKAAWSDVARRVAHEIKNPLTPIKLAAERLEKKYLKNITNPEDQIIFKSLTETIEKHSNGIKRLIDEFSTFARLPEPIKSKCDVSEICESSIIFAQNTNNTIKYVYENLEGKVVLDCDENLIQQVINNLLKNSANAIIYAKDRLKINTAPEIKLTIIKNTANFVSIFIQDNGPGFAKEYMDKFLQPYFSLTPKGTGLGLVISNKIVSDHGGRLIINNLENGCGAVVEVMLPY